METFSFLTRVAGGEMLINEVAGVEFYRMNRISIAGDKGRRGFKEAR